MVSSWSLQSHQRLLFFRYFFYTNCPFYLHGTRYTQVLSSRVLHIGTHQEFFCSRDPHVSPKGGLLRQYLCVITSLQSYFRL